MKQVKIFNLMSELRGLALKNKKERQKGQLLLELLIAVSAAALIIIVSSSLIYVSLSGNKIAREQNVAAGLLEETIEAVNNAARENWSNIATLTKGSTNYFPQISSTKWAITAGTNNITLSSIVYTRSFVIQNICRDTSTRSITGLTDTSGSATTCTTNGGSNDPSTQLITATISWNSRTLSTAAYLTRWPNTLCIQSSWASVGAGPSTCPPTTYGSETNITTGSSLSICTGGC